MEDLTDFDRAALAAVDRRCLASLRELLEGASPNARVRRGWGEDRVCLLHIASRWPEGTRALLDAGADPDLQLEGCNPLLAWVTDCACGLEEDPAAVCRCAEVLRILLDAGADPSGGAAAGEETPLHAACFAAAFQDRAEMITMLLERGAPTEARDRHGRRPEDCITQRSAGDSARAAFAEWRRARGRKTKPARKNSA